MRTLTLTLPDAATEAAFFEWLTLHPQAVADGDQSLRVPDRYSPQFLAEIRQSLAEMERGETLPVENLLNEMQARWG
jgi:hypothetical protein